MCRNSEHRWGDRRPERSYLPSTCCPEGEPGAVKLGATMFARSPSREAKGPAQFSADEAALSLLLPSRRSRLVLAVLLLINIFNFVDRQLPSILISAIKVDLGLTDGQIGLMAGLSFAVVYSMAALPLAWAADRISPRWVLVGSLSVWSAMTALSGLAGCFSHLLLARAGVAASEAGATPAAHAIIARTIEPERRAVALAFFSLGVPVGSTLGLMLGGWINDVADWRTAFFFVGAPGLALALVCAFVLPGANASASDGASNHGAPFSVVLRRLLALPAFAPMAIACAFYACGSYAINVFAPAFLMRVHGLTAAQAGLRMGMVFGIGGLAGTLLGGFLADRLGRRNAAWRQLVPAVGQWLSLPTGLAAWLVHDPNLATAMLMVSYMSSLLYFAPTFAALQMLVPDSIRATASAILLSALTLVGACVGPLAVGWISDWLSPDYGVLSLRYAMCSMGVPTILSALFFHLSAKRLPHKMGAATGG